MLSAVLLFYITSLCPVLLGCGLVFNKKEQQAKNCCSFGGMSVVTDYFFMSFSYNALRPSTMSLVMSSASFAYNMFPPIRVRMKS